MYFPGGSFAPIILFQQSKQNSAIDITLFQNNIYALQLQCILSDIAGIN